MKFSIKIFVTFAFIFSTQIVSAMGLRSFVALPVDKGGSVLRFLADFNPDTNTNVLLTSLAYGLSGTQTLLFEYLIDYHPMEATV